MNMHRNNEAFDDLRALAHRLDIRLGTERRKLILIGHERLTMASDSQDWAKWLMGVESRLKTVAGVSEAAALLKRPE